MPIPLLGGLALGLATKGGYEYGKSRMEKRKKTLLDQQIDQAQNMLMANPQDPAVQMQYRQQMINAGLPPAEVTERIDTARQVGPYADPTDMQAAAKSMRGETMKALSPFQQAIQYYNEAVQIKGGDVTKWTGTDDFAAIRKFIKQSLPNESVMGDDINNLKFSQGVPEYVKGWIQSLMGKGGLSKTGRRELLATMENEARTRMARRDEIRGFWEQQAQGANLDPESVMMPAQNVMPLPQAPQVEPTGNMYTPPPDDMYEYKRDPVSGKLMRRKRG